MSLKDEFINIFESNITREGSKKLLEWLKGTDFFTTPASTRYHCACEGGLLMHSINVYNVMMKYFEETKDSKESFAIVSLLHDI